MVVKIIQYKNINNIDNKILPIVLPLISNNNSKYRCKIHKKKKFKHKALLEKIIKIKLLINIK